MATGLLQLSPRPRSRRRFAKTRAAIEPLHSSPAVIPALLAVALILTLGASEGGFAPRNWYPVAIVLLALLTVVALTVPVRRPIARSVLVATALLAGYAAWAYLSVTWADNQGEAWDGANRTVLYLIVFALFALWRLSRDEAATVVGFLGLGIAALGLVILLRADASADALPYFLDGRLTDPVGYVNANVAFWFTGFFPCLLIATRREVNPVLRGLALGGAELLAGMALMGQSRGWLFSLPVILVLFVIVVPGRARGAVAIMVVAAGAVLWLGPVLDIRDGIRAGDAPEPLLGEAADALLLATWITTLVGLAVAFADRRVRLSERRSRRISAAFVAAVAAVAISVATVAVLDAGDPIGRVTSAWEQFKAGGDASGGDDRLSGAVGTNRYDFWRVAWSQFERDPLTGAGIDNFQQDYLERGTSPERPRHTHSLELKVISQTGLVGAVLLVGAFAAALFAALRAGWRREGLAGATAGAATMTFLYWFVHGSVDWFWEFPALGAAAFAMLGLAASLAPARQADPAQDTVARRLATRPLAVGAVLIVALVGAAGLVPPWLAQRHVDRALDVWPTRADEAFDGLDRAASLNPLSSQPAVTAAAIALQLDRPYTADASYRSALARNPRSAFATLEAGALASQLGRPRDARRLLERAGALNPRDEITQAALRRHGRDRKVLDAAEIYGEALERSRQVGGAGAAGGRR